MKKAFLFLIAILCWLVAFLACTNDTTNSPSMAPSKTKSILGLDQNHTNLYQKFDSLVLYSPSYQLVLDTSLVTYTVYDIDSNQTKYDIAVSSEKLARLIITTKSVAISGYYQKIDDYDSLFHFIYPPEIMPNQLNREETWQFYVPPLHRDGRELITSFLNFGFGYEIRRTYLGKEDIVVPAGAYDAYVVQSEYMLAGSTEVIKTDVEYLVEGIGLVRMYSTGNFGTSHILLIETDLQ